MKIWSIVIYCLVILTWSLSTSTNQHRHRMQSLFLIEKTMCVVKLSIWRVFHLYTNHCYSHLLVLFFSCFSLFLWFPLYTFTIINKQFNTMRWHAYQIKVHYYGHSTHKTFRFPHCALFVVLLFRFCDMRLHFC